MYIRLYNAFWYFVFTECFLVYWCVKRICYSDAMNIKWVKITLKNLWLKYVPLVSFYATRKPQKPRNRKGGIKRFSGGAWKETRETLLKTLPTNCFSFEDFSQILSTRRNTSAPGLNGIPYKVYKKYPKVDVSF